MDLPSLSNAPRELVVDGATYRARTLTLNQLGEVLAWLEERVEADEAGEAGEADDPDSPFRFASDASQVALATDEGIGLVLHLALSSCHPDISRDAARSLASALDPAAYLRLRSIAFRRRPAYRPPAEGRGKDLAEADWGIIWEALSQHQAGMYGACGDITLDQLDSFLARGDLDDDADRLSMSEFQRMYEEAKGADGEGESPPDPSAVLRPGESIVEAPSDGG